MNAQLKILNHMLNNAENPEPWKIQDFISLSLAASTIYEAIKKLNRFGLVSHVSSGFILSNKILNAGALRQNALARAVAQNNMEKIYGKTK